MTQVIIQTFDYKISKPPLNRTKWPELKGSKIARCIFRVVKEELEMVSGLKPAYILVN